MNKEEWKYIDGYNGRYQISNFGVIKNTETGRILKTYKDKYGYMVIKIKYNGKIKHHLIHRLIAETFLPNPENKPHIDHKNTIKDDNTLWLNEDGSINYDKTNLKWVTKKENNNNPLTRKHLSTAMKKYGSMIGKKGRLCPNSKIVLELNGADNDKIERIWFSTMDIEREKGISNQKVSNICKGKRKRTAEYSFQYMEDFLAEWWDKQMCFDTQK